MKFEFIVHPRSGYSWEVVQEAATEKEAATAVFEKHGGAIKIRALQRLGSGPAGDWKCSWDEPFFIPDPGRFEIGFEDRFRWWRS